ncbi:MAG TPA: hypothetical protein PLC40_18635, partial [Candidatus Hydrogenedentes bacterium]|nr:hypothetical protein [Candidatus Hydrogenedentota bacterium]
MLEEQAIVNPDGLTATLDTDKTGLFLGILPNANSTPAFIDEPDPDAPFDATLKKVSKGGSNLIPLVLIHGAGSYKDGNYGRWDKFIDWATGPGASMMSRFQIWWFKHYTGYPIGFNEGTSNAAAYRPNSAYEFNERLNEARGRQTDPFPSADQPFVIVAHSRGGLVARAWMQNFPGAADQVIAALTLSTPHHGSTLAVPDWNYHNIRYNYGLSVPCPPSIPLCIPFQIQEFILTFATGKFDWYTPGGADLAWDNFDYKGKTQTFGFGVPYKEVFKLDTTFGGVWKLWHTLSDHDVGWPCPADSDTDLHLPPLYENSGRGYTLWDLNHDDSASFFFSKAILYGGYYSSPGVSIHDYDIWDENSQQRVAGEFMAKQDSRGADVSHYAANDGLVALQSALAL